MRLLHRFLRLCFIDVYLFKIHSTGHLVGYHNLYTMKRINDSSKDESSPKKSKPSGHWSNALLSAMEDPCYKVNEDDLVVVIKDKYPKAKFHYLVLPKEDIPTLKSVEKKHLNLLNHMHEVGMKLIQEDLHKDSDFKLGYHAQASMGRLHLHVISDDMISPCIKTKKHWNSFTTEFFLLSDEVCELLKETGKIELLPSEECKKLMNRALQCHKCEFVPKHMPDLKKHILDKHE